MRPRFSPAREVALGLGVYALYLGVREAVLRRNGRERALGNARRVVELEERLGIHVEQRVQQACLHAPRVVHALNVGYGAFNVMLTVGLLMRMYARRDPGFHGFRRTAVAAHLLAQPVFLLLPTAPPRTLDGFVDTMAEVSGFDLEHPVLVRLYNPVAAMPSLHAAFAVLTSRELARRTRGPARAAWRAYPAVVALVVLSTGNHYALDVAAGAALGRVAERVAR